MAPRRRSPSSAGCASARRPKAFINQRRWSRIALKTIGEAARFFLTRHWVRRGVGPYVITTVEVRPSAYETSVTWGEDGPEVEHFGSELTFDLGEAKGNQARICARVEAAVGPARPSVRRPPAA